MKLSIADLLLTIPEDWLTYLNGECGYAAFEDKKIEWEMDRGNLAKITFWELDYLHRDPFDGPAYIWYVGDQIYEKYFWKGLPSKSPDGYFGKVKKTDGSILISY